MIEVVTNSTAETMVLGHRLGQLLMPGAVVLLKGDLGAGKTHFAKGVATGLGISENITSPTFTLINEYQGRIPLYHMDFYRLDGAEEAFDLGVEEYFYGLGATLIEWPDKIKSFIPNEFIEITLHPVSEEKRRITVISIGHKYDGLLRELKKIVHSGN